MNFSNNCRVRGYGVAGKAATHLPTDQGRALWEMIEPHSQLATESLRASIDVLLAKVAGTVHSTLCCSARRRGVRLAASPEPAVSPERIPPLGLPSMQTMMDPDTRCISLATFNTARELQEYLDGFSREEKKAKVNDIDSETYYS